MLPRPWFNIKMSSYQYRKSHCGDKTVVRSSYLHNEISYTIKMSSLYWIGPLFHGVFAFCIWHKLYCRMRNGVSTHRNEINQEKLFWDFVRLSETPPSHQQACWCPGDLTSFFWNTTASSPEFLVWQMHYNDMDGNGELIMPAMYHAYCSANTNSWVACLWIINNPIMCAINSWVNNSITLAMVTTVADLS